MSEAPSCVVQVQAAFARQAKLVLMKELKNMNADTLSSLLGAESANLWGTIIKDLQLRRETAQQEVIETKVWRCIACAKIACAMRM